MASAPPQPPAGPAAQAAPVSLGARLAAAIALLLCAAAVFALLVAFGAVPRPGSVAGLAREQAIGRARVVVAGYYVTLPFESMGGPQLPPYVFAAGSRSGAPSVHVAPALSDVTADKVAAVIDTSTGDGSEASPFVIHTIARWDRFVAAAIVGLIIAVAFALWLGGTVVALIRRR